MVKKEHRDHWHCCGSGFGFGLFILLVGLVWLAKELGYVANVPLLPLIVVFFGLWLIVGKAGR